MLALLFPWVAAAEPVVAVRASDADGAVVFDEILPLPSARDLVTPGDDPVALSLYVTRFDRTRGMIELGIGPAVDGKVRRFKFRHSEELDAWRPIGLHAGWRRAVWDLVVVLHESTEAPPPEPPPAGDDRFVVVGGAPMRVVGLPDDTNVAAEPAGEGHCVDGAAPAAGTWSRQQLPLVTAREVAAALPDGSGYRVAAGVPVRPLGGPRFSVSTGGISFVIEAADGDLDVLYRPSAHWAAGGTGWSLPAGALGDTALGEVRWEGEGTAPVAGLTGYDPPLATVQTRCAEVRFRVDPSALSR